MKKKLLAVLTIGLLSFCIVGIVNAIPIPISAELTLNTIVGFDTSSSSNFGPKSNSATYYEYRTTIDTPLNGSVSASLQDNGSTLNSSVTIESLWNDPMSGEINYSSSVNFSYPGGDPSNYAYNQFNNFWSYSFSHDYKGEFILNYRGITTTHSSLFGSSTYNFPSINYQINNGTWNYFDQNSSTLSILVDDGGIFQFAVGWSPYGPNGSGYNAINSYSSSVSRENIMDWKFVESTPPSSEPIPEPSTMLLFGIGIAGLIGVRSRKKH